MEDITMKSFRNLSLLIVFLILFPTLLLSQEVEVNLGGNSTSDAFVVKDSSGNVLLKMDGDQNFGINSEQPDGIEIIGRSTTTEYENGDPIKIIGGSSDDRDGGSVSIIGGSGSGSGGDHGGSIIISSGDGYHGGDIDIRTGNASGSNSGTINISTGNGGTPGHINLNTAYGNANLGSITLSTGQEYQPANSWQGHITLATGRLGSIKLLSSTGISLKTTDYRYGSNIRLETSRNNGGENNIFLIVGDSPDPDGVSRGIILNPNVGLVEVIGSGTYTGSWTQASDRRYKSNIKPLLNLLNNVMLLQPVEYDWKKEEFPENNFPDGNQIGLIAQEVEELFPEIVATNRDGYKSVDYSKLSVLLLQSMKEQQNEIEKQSDEISEMKSDIEELKLMILQKPNKFSSNDNQQEVN